VQLRRRKGGVIRENVRVLVNEGCSVVDLIVDNEKQILDKSPPSQLHPTASRITDWGAAWEALYLLSAVRRHISKCEFFRLRHDECLDRTVCEKGKLWEWSIGSKSKR